MNDAEDAIRTKACELALMNYARQILSGECSILHGACAMYCIVKELDLEETSPFDFLWAVSSDCSELPMDESCRFGRHPDLLARQDIELLELAEFYRPRVLLLCHEVVKLYPNTYD